MKNNCMYSTVYQMVTGFLFCPNFSSRKILALPLVLTIVLNFLYLPLFLLENRIYYPLWNLLDQTVLDGVLALHLFYDTRPEV